MTEYLTFKQLVEIACRVTATSEAPVRDWGLLESALNRPQANIFGADAYPTLHEKVAALMHSLARNHALIDGNTRLAFMAVYVIQHERVRAGPTERRRRRGIRARCRPR